MAGLSTQFDRDTALFHHLVDGIKDYAIFMIDISGTLVTWNPGVKRLLGYDEQEFIGKSFSEIFVEEDRKLKVPEGELKTAQKDGKAEDERWHLKKDGSQFWASGLVTLMKAEDGTIQGFTKIMRDQTQKKQFEEKLAEQANTLALLNKELTNFAGVVSHDLNAPLQTVFGFANVLKTQEGLGSEAEESVEHIISGTKRMIDLVSELLEYSTVGKNEQSMAFVDTDDLLKKVTLGLNALISKSHACVQCEALPTVWGDKTQLSRIFQNLIENAIKYSDKERPTIIKIAAKDHDSETIFSIEDNGRGIEKSEMSRLFTLFERLEPDAHVPGKGIGLATCKKIIERYGGRMWVESTAGTGSTFFFSVPNALVSNQTPMDQISNLSITQSDHHLSPH